MPESARQSLVEHYANEARFSDGDVYRFYRIAQDANDQKAVKKWLARISASKKRNLMQLERSDHGRVVKAFDALIPFVGLWQDFQLGSLNRILPMRVWQVLAKIRHR